MGEDSVEVILTELKHVNSKLDALAENHKTCRSHCDTEMPAVHGRITNMGERVQAIETRCQVVQDNKSVTAKAMPHWIHTAIIAISIIIGILISVKVH